MGWVDGFKGHRSSKSILGANKYTTYDINLSMILLLHNFVIFLRI